MSDWLILGIVIYLFIGAVLAILAAQEIRYSWGVIPAGSGWRLVGVVFFWPFYLLWD